MTSFGSAPERSSYLESGPITLVSLASLVVDLAGELSSLSRELYCSCQLNILLESIRRPIEAKRFDRWLD
jgi:hypothetical protein